LGLWPLVFGCFCRYIYQEPIQGEARDMKIDPNQEIVKSVYPDKATGPDKPADNKFGTMLKDAINNKHSKH
jgi:hypothetical protein